MITYMLRKYLLRKYFLRIIIFCGPRIINNFCSIEHEAVPSQLRMSLFKYSFKRNCLLPSPNGPLSREIPATAISAANDEVMKALEDDKGVKRRGPYQKHTDKEKTKIGKYALMHGATAALRHFKDRYSELKYTTICEWKKAIAAEEKKSQQPVTELKSKKRGRPSLLPDKITTLLMKYIHAIRDAGGIINTAIVITAGLGIAKRIDSRLPNVMVVMSCSTKAGQSIY